MLTLDEEKPTINKEMPNINISQVESDLKTTQKESDRIAPPPV